MNSFVQSLRSHYKGLDKSKNPVTELILFHRQHGAREAELAPREYAHLCAHGGCAQYANFLHRSLPGSVIHVTPMHDWVEHEGRHYDALTPHGVEDPRRLSYFRSRPQHAHLIDKAETVTQDWGGEDHLENVQRWRNGA